MAKAIGRGERGKRARLVAQWRRSGRSAAEFGARQGISPWALYSWAKRLGTGSNGRGRARGAVRGMRSARTPGFIPVRLLEDGHAAPSARAEGIVEIQLGGGDVVRVLGEVSVDRLRAVMTAVRQAC